MKKMPEIEPYNELKSMSIINYTLTFTVFGFYLDLDYIDKFSLTFGEEYFPRIPLKQSFHL